MNRQGILSSGFKACTEKIGVCKLSVRDSDADVPKLGSSSCPTDADAFPLVIERLLFPSVDLVGPMHHWNVSCRRV